MVGIDRWRPSEKESKLLLYLSPRKRAYHQVMPRVGGSLGVTSKSWASQGFFGWLKRSEC